MATRTAPPLLGKAGKKLWREIAGEYDLRADEFRILEDCAREADLIESLTEAQREQPIMIKGSMGQEILHPLIAEVRQHRATLSVLLTKLKLPDDPDAATGTPVGDDTATKARSAAQARWSRRGA